MKKYRILLVVLVVTVVLGIGLNSLIGSTSIGKSVSESVASTLRGGCCQGADWSDDKCETIGTCEARYYVVTSSEKEHTVSGDSTCGLSGSCAFIQANMCGCQG